MGRRKAEAPSTKRAPVIVVKRRKPRDGARINMNVRLVHDHALWLKQRAAEELTDPCEIVMDLVDQKRAQLAGIAAKRDAGAAA